MAKKESITYEQLIKKLRYDRRHSVSTGNESRGCAPDGVNFEDEVVSTSELVDGVLVKKNELKKVDTTERNKGLNYWDFSVDSLSASGAIADLKFSQLSGDRMDIADSIGVQADNMSVVDNNDKNIEE